MSRKSMLPPCRHRYPPRARRILAERSKCLRFSCVLLSSKAKRTAPRSSSCCGRSARHIAKFVLALGRAAVRQSGSWLTRGTVGAAAVKRCNREGAQSPSRQSTQLPAVTSAREAGRCRCCCLSSNAHVVFARSCGSMPGHVQWETDVTADVLFCTLRCMSKVRSCCWGHFA